MARPSKPVNRKDHIRMCGLHVNQGWGAPKIAAVMPEYHKSRVSRLLKKCPEIMDSAVGRDTIARVYAQPLAAITHSVEIPENVRTRTPADRDKKSAHQQNPTPPPMSDPFTTLGLAINDDEEEELDDDDYDLDSLLYDAAYPSPPQRPTFMTGLIDPFRFLNDMVNSNFNSSIIRTMSQLAENLNRKFFPNLYPTPKIEVNSPKTELPDKNDESEKQNVIGLGTERTCCQLLKRQTCQMGQSL